MKEAKTDRRVRYTIIALKDALVVLMKNNHISKISVKSICEQADINRSTFYAHFKDQYDLLHHIEREALDNIKRYLARQDYNPNLPVTGQALTRILEYVKDNAALFFALLSDNGDLVIQREIMSLAQMFPIPIGKGYDERTREYLALFGTTGCVSVLQKWLEDNMPESPAELSNMILQMIYSGMADFA